MIIAGSIVLAIGLVVVVPAHRSKDSEAIAIYGGGSVGMIIFGLIMLLVGIFR